jgi:LysM repeat protein
LVFIAIAPVGILLILGMMLRRLARAMRKWWPTHRVLTAAFLIVIAGTMTFQGQALLSHLTSPPRTSHTIAAPSRPTSPRVPSTRTTTHPNVPPGAAVQPPPARPAPPPAPPRTNDLYVVQPGDTLWGLASRYLGNPLRYQELFALNQGVSQVAGHTLVDPNLIYPGMTLQFPADATGMSPISSVAAGPAPRPPPNTTLGGGGQFAPSALSP